MKQMAYTLVLTLGLLVVGSGIPPAQSGTMGHGPAGHAGEATESSPAGQGGMMGPGMMGRGGMGMMGSPLMREMMPEMERGGMHGGPGMMGMHRPRQLLRMLKTELELSDAQVEQLRPIVREAIKTGIRDRASLRVAQIDLGELLETEPVDMAKVESQLKTIEGLRTQLRLNMIQAHEQAKAFLTPEQRQKLASLHERLMGMMERIGPGGMRGMGVTGPGMQAGMRSGRGPMMQMQGMMQQLGGMTRQMAERLETGQMTPEQMKHMGEVMEQMSNMMGGVQGMMGGMGPGTSRQQMMERMSGMMQHMSDMQKHMSEMMRMPQSHHEPQQP
jgi:Spy/CpxP family protein refolding chaperone